MSLAPDENTSLVADLAIARGMVTREQVDEAYDVMAKMAELGVPEELGKVLVKKGFISDSQLRELETRVTPKQPTTIGGFEITSRLGRGGMGAVYKARQVSMDRIVALKVLPPALAKDKNFIERFFREARAVARLNHPNIVQGIDVGVGDKYYYFAMEYVDGETVQAMIRRDGPLPEKQALQITQQIAQALHHAHRHDMIHRDIKPDNIMMTTGGVAKLCDLGLAKSLSGDSSVTQTGLAVGTPHYISPEQARGEADVDVRADIYSLGASLYHMVCGQTPFQGSSAAVVMTKHLNDDIPNPRDVNPNLSIGLCRLIEKMMAKDRGERYQTPEDVIKDLDLVIVGKTPAALRLAAGHSVVRGSGRHRPGIARRTTTRPVEAVEPKKSPVALLAIIAGVLVLAGAGIGIYALTNNDEQVLPPPPINGGTGNGGEVKPEDPPEKTPIDNRVDKLRSRLAAIQAHWKKHPTQFKGVYDSLRFLKDDAAGTAIALEAQKLIDEVRGKQRAYNAAAFAKAKAKADKLVDVGKYGEALKVFSELPISPEIMTNTEREHKRIRALAMDHYRRKILGPARKKINIGQYTEARKGDLAAARAILKGVDSFGMPRIAKLRDRDLASITSEHRKRLADLAKRIATAKKAEADARRLRFNDARKKIFDEAAVVDADKLFGFKAAAATADMRLFRRDFAPLKAEAERIKRDLKSLADLQTNLPGLIRISKGSTRKIHYGNQIQSGTVVDMDNRCVQIKPRNVPGSMSVFYYTIAPEDLITLTGKDPTKPADAYLVGILAFYSKRHDKAVPMLRVAAKDKRLAADARYYLTIATAAYRKMREEGAAQLLDECRATFKQLKTQNVPAGDRRWAELTSKLEELKKDFKDTDVVRKNLGK